MAKKKRILILGAGISGLSLAWYLRQSPTPLEITILEKTERAGGWLHTDLSSGFLFEKGPRTFRVDKSPAIIELLDELKLGEEITWSQKKPYHRYLWLNDELLRFPSNPFSFLVSPLTTGFIRALLTEWKKTVYYGDETVWDFVSRRFNQDVARLFFDPLVIGIFGGDSRHISVRSCFPVLKQWEETHGSMTKGFLLALKQKRDQSKYSSVMPELPLSAIYSLNKGIEQLVAELIDQTRVEVKYQTEVTAIRDLEKGVEVVAGDRVYQADAIFCALPVSATRHLLNSFAPHHAEKLSTLKSFSITVINVGYTAQVLPVKGFGYLTSRDSKEEILGVIFDSCVFPEHNRSASETRLTIKLQGRGLSKDSMIEIALQGIKKHLGITRLPDAISYKLAVNAIPQYGVGHLDEMAQLEEELMTQFPRFRFVGNYLSGTSVDRCIARSKDVAYQWLEQHL